MCIFVFCEDCETFKNNRNVKACRECPKIAELKEYVNGKEENEQKTSN